MDKYEYKARSEEIFKLIDEEKYAEAVSIADEVDWRRVKSSTALLKIAALYRVNRRNEDARAVLLLAYERYPTNRSVVYSLCEISTELDDVVAATEYYKQFVKLAPRDNGVFTLLYRILEAQEASLEERIQLLEELKKRDYQEEWAYELAYLYHRVGLATKCVEECDDLILWFGEGSYVMKAMELKMLHAPLTEVQQMKYDEMLNRAHGSYRGADEAENSYDAGGYHSEYDDNYSEGPYGAEAAYASGNDAGEDYENYSGSYHYGGYAGNTEEFYVEHTSAEEPCSAQNMPQNYSDEEYADAGYPQNGYADEGYTDAGYSQQDYADGGYSEENYADAAYANEGYPEEGYSDENYPDAGYSNEGRSEENYGNVVYMDAYAGEAYGNGAAYADEHRNAVTSTPSSVDMSQYNTINLQKVVAESMRELFLNSGEEEKTPVSETVSETVSSKPEAEGYPDIEDSDLRDSDIKDSGIKSFDIDAPDLYAQTQVVQGKEYEKLQQTIERGTDETNAAHGLTEWDGALPEPDESDMPESGTPEPGAGEAYGLDTEPDREPMHTGRVAAMVTNVSEASPEPHTGAIRKVFVPGDDARLIKEDTDIDELRDTTESLAASEQARMEEQHENVYHEQAKELPEGQAAPAEQRITGSLDLGDVLAEWERMKLQNAQKHQEEVRQQVLSQTGKIFKDFDDSIKEGILGELDAPAQDEPEPEKPAVQESSLVYGAAQDTEPMEEVYQESVRDRIEEETEGRITDGEPLISRPDKSGRPDDSAKAQMDPDKAELIAEMAREDAIHTQEIKMSTAELSSLSDKILAATKKEAKGAKREEIREFSPEEQKLFENFAVTRKIKKQIIYALDHMTLTAHTGNVILTGEAGLDTVRMAKNLVHEFQEADHGFSGKAAKITGEKINQRSLKEIFDKLENGAIIIEKANGMTEEKLYEMASLLNQENIGIIIIMEDTGKEIARLLKKQAMVADYFNIRIDLIEMDTNALVAYAKNYALALEYSIDELGTLALYTRISNIQSGNHVVTKDEVRDIIDEAIWRSKRSKIKNFVDVLFSKRYDSEDMIVLKERDFM